ncbi:MAG: hypothetical protein RMK29_05195 [Myxococcales bacterium]|nr:hypothetical protein [Myxococcota bacterium]MDW8281086.1 hypothetical protein [Myxococcales bacterium]
MSRARPRAACLVLLVALALAGCRHGAAAPGPFFQLQTSSEGLRIPPGDHDRGSDLFSTAALVQAEAARWVNEEPAVPSPLAAAAGAPAPAAPAPADRVPAAAEMAPPGGPRAVQGATDLPERHPDLAAEPASGRVAVSSILQGPSEPRPLEADKKRKKKRKDKEPKDKEPKERPDPAAAQSPPAGPAPPAGSAAGAPSPAVGSPPPGAPRRPAGPPPGPPPAGARSP